jgi:hypothetical protein
MRCVELKGWLAWLVVYVILMIVISLGSAMIPGPAGIAIASAAKLVVSIIGAGIFINMLFSAFGSKIRCEKEGYWSPWPPLAGRRYHYDAQGNQIRDL